MKHPAYQLRPNKAIDRSLLLKAIEVMNGLYDLCKHTYIGFGGPFLDDIRLISQQFPQLRYVSIERDEDTHKRQRFHCTSKRLRFVHNTVGTYLKQDFISDTPSIFWLDYIDLSPSDIEEFAEVLELVGCPSIVKVTVRSQFDHALLEAAQQFLDEEGADKFKKAKIGDVQRKFDDYIERELTEDDLEPRQFAMVVQSMFRVVAQRTLPSLGGKVFQLVHSCRYSDGPQMLTLTGVVCETSERKRIQSEYRKWSHSNLDWKEPDHIDMPNLSLKERLHLEKHLPALKGTGKALQRCLGYMIDENQIASERKLRQYQDFHQFYPMFAKIHV